MGRSVEVGIPVRNWRSKNALLASCTQDREPKASGNADILVVGKANFVTRVS